MCNDFTAFPEEMAMGIVPAAQHGVHVATAAVAKFGSEFGDGFGSEFHTTKTNVLIVADLFKEHGARQGVTLLKDGMKEQGGAGVKDALLATFVHPIKNDVQAKRYGSAAGRLSFYLATSWLPGDKEVRAAAAIAARSAT
jgi:hypothetical protein